ncbi:MAG: response regulator transcription factor [Tepidisphaeraceae bacterium]
MRVLLVVPEPTRARELSLVLREQNVEVETVSTAGDATTKVEANTYTAVVLEHELSATNAGAWVQHFREKNHGTPVVVLTNDPNPQTKIDLLDLGADDVILHPVVEQLLPAYIRALARRCQPGESAVLKFDDLSLDLRSWQVIRRDQQISCTSREVAVLEYLMRNRQRVISRDELSSAVWDGESPPDSNVIEVFIARLRRKIDKPFDVPFIHTIVGRGYMLSATKPGVQPLA